MTAPLTAIGTLLGILLGFGLSWGIQESLIRTQTIKLASITDAYYQKENECRMLERSGRKWVRK